MYGIKNIFILVLSLISTAECYIETEEYVVTHNRKIIKEIKKCPVDNDICESHISYIVDLNTLQKKVLVGSQSPVICRKANR